MMTMMNQKLSENQRLHRELSQLKLATEVIKYDVGDGRKSRRILSNNEEFIFIGGIPRSGTTLMRAMLDAHPDVRCGGETMLLPNFLTWQRGWRLSEWTNNSGITQQVFDDASSAFITEIIGKHGEMAPRLCNKDPYTALWLPTLRRLFPNAKYLLMIRDARAIIHSMIERKVPVAGYNTSNEIQMFRKWNQEIQKMYFQCETSAGLCLKVYYERLIQKPKEEVERICKFLDIPYSDQMLRHQELIGVEVEINDQEFSASQIKNSINSGPLTSWFDCISPDVLNQIGEIAPFLAFLGYNTSSTKPSYDRFTNDDFYNFRNNYS
ncbi:unnamed protein product [Caenorhabditis bovis]|uniref:Protein-tyrosine sulfotransferase n=1 Tax=Caenorhabditis bovis TaxID=2654633 RepID=A0A8S1EVU2_9PELO|nr:unnamed protein product [Caenorhabditis bovis]